MMVVDARTQHRPDRPHDCAVCRTTAMPIAPPKTASLYIRVRPRCGAAMPKTKGLCARPEGHPDGHRTYRGMYGRLRMPR